MAAPEQPTHESARPGGYGFTPVAGARMPIPGNAEFAVFFLIWIVLIIIWAASDQVDAGLFATLTTVLTFGYLLSRGIAKASRVLEQ
ncbi:MAG TPA: hypothetical protein VJT84_05220 [Gaiellaceae bacterium]|nr:hypothetical protein [Gaiellaceae bacterium]